MNVDLHSKERNQKALLTVIWVSIDISILIVSREDIDKSILIQEIFISSHIYKTLVNSKLTKKKVDDLFMNLIYIMNLLYIIMSRHRHGYPWPFLATLLYRPLLLAGLQGYIPNRHRAAVCRFKLVVQLLLVHVKGSTGVHPLWVRAYFSTRVMHVWSSFDTARDGR